MKTLKLKTKRFIFGGPYNQQNENKKGGKQKTIFQLTKAENRETRRITSMEFQCKIRIDNKSTLDSNQQNALGRIHLVLEQDWLFYAH